MNFMDSSYPYYLRMGFWLFLQSEKVGHQEDINKIDTMLADLENLTPALADGEVRESLMKFLKRFVKNDRKK